MKTSPSSINTFFRCKRLFYHNYILKKTLPPNIHLYKGTFTHKILENLFLSMRFVDMNEKYVEKVMLDWNPPQGFVKDEKDNEFHKKEVELMLLAFGKRLKEKLEMIIFEGKAKELNHAWNLAKPKLREHKIFDEVEQITGIIDSVETDYDDRIYLVDYKTSKLYRHTMPEEYFRQISLYAYLYRQEFGKLPHYVAIHYLRYGEVFIMPVTEETITNVLKDVHSMKEFISLHNDINDYTPCEMGWCDHHKLDKETI